MLATSLVDAATVKQRARLREGPSKETTLLGWLDQGTGVAIEGSRYGWYAVRTPDGLTGYIWQDNLAFDPGERPDVPASTTTTLATSVVAAPTASATTTTILDSPPPPMPEITGELERLRAEVGRLATAQEELSKRLAQGVQPVVPATASGDGSAGAAALFLGAGAVVGWILGRLGPRRDRRSRIRI